MAGPTVVALRVASLSARLEVAHKDARTLVRLASVAATEEE